MPDTETPPVDEDVDAAYLAICKAAEQFDGNPYAVEALSLAAVVLSGDTKGCDACDRMLDPEPFGYAGMSWAVMLDGNGDPDVSICPVCRAEESAAWFDAEGDPQYPDPRPPLVSLAVPSTEGANDE